MKSRQPALGLIVLLCLTSIPAIALGQDMPSGSPYNPDGGMPIPPVAPAPTQSEDFEDDGDLGTPSTPPSSSSSASEPQTTTPPADAATAESATTLSDAQPNLQAPAASSDSQLLAPEGGETRADSVTPTAEGHAPFFWRNSLFLFDQAVHANSFFRDSQLSWNPTYIWTLTFLPRFYPVAGENYFIRLNQTMQIEWTDSDGSPTAAVPTTLNRYPYFYDLTIDFIKPALLSFEGINLTAGVRTAIPWSIISRANQLLFVLGVTTNLSYAVPNANLTIQYITNYTHNFHGANAVSVQAGFPCSSSALGFDSGQCFAAGGSSNVSDSLTTGPTLLWAPVPELTLSLSYLYLARFARALAPVPLGDLISSGSTDVLPDMSRSHWRELQSFSLSASYDFFKWMNLALNLSTFTGIREDTGALRNPFFNTDTQLTLTATFTLDQLYDAITGEGVVLSEEQLRRIRQGQASGPRQQGGI